MKILVMLLLVIGHLVMAEVVAGRSAAAVTLDFEELDDVEVVTTQFTGLTFTNTVALVAGGHLTELEFPPHSGATVVMDLFGAITIAFDTPVSAASGFFTYSAPVTITAYDALHTPVDTATSAFEVNSLLSGEAGSAANELLEVAFAGGISSVRLRGDANGLSFTLDDFTFVPLAVTAPLAATEPRTPVVFVILGAAAVAVVGWRRRGAAWPGGRVQAAY